MGGVKTETSSGTKGSSLAMRQLKEPDVAERLRAFLRQPNLQGLQPRSMNELAMLISVAKTALRGIITGPRTLSQLQETMGFWSKVTKLEMCDADRQVLLGLCDSQ